MSLIYDYLKIIGESGFEENPKVEIPPILKRRYTNRFNTQSFLKHLGACLIGVLIIFLVIKIFTPGREHHVTVVSKPVSQPRVDQPEPVTTSPESLARRTAEPAAVSKPVSQSRMDQPGPVPTPPESRAGRTAEPAAAKNIEGPEETRGLPATVKPVIVDTTASTSIAESSVSQQRALREKKAKPLELKSTKQKKVFSRNITVYSGVQESNKEIATAVPAPTGKTSAAEAKSSTSPDAGSAVQDEKSDKFYQAGLQAQYKGDGRLAEIYYKKALEQVPHHMNAMINLSALYVQQGRLAEAERILAEILAIEPANSKALVNMGMVSLYRNNESRAAAQFEAALAANPREENALVNLAYIAEKNRDYLSAEGYYRQLLQIAPDNLEVLLAYGHLLEEQKRYAEAMVMYAETLELGPVKKDRRLYNKISDRMRLLAGVVKNSQP